MFQRLAMEPPFRIVVRALLKWLPVSAYTRALWDLSARPAYFLGVLAGAGQAKRERVSRICVVEFGVAGGKGLLALEEAAHAIECELGVRIDVYGFDAGPGGLPAFCGDYRDHPDLWKAGDFQMDVGALRHRLDSTRTTLVLGPVAETVPQFVRSQSAPIGFASVDLDLYSSTKDALGVFTDPHRRMLTHVPLYFDDIDFLSNHRFAGELLAIEEFNAEVQDVKIDRWYGVKGGRPFPERPFLDKLYIAHDLHAIGQTVLNRENVQLPLKKSMLDFKRSLLA